MSKTTAYQQLRHAISVLNPASRNAGGSDLAQLATGVAQAAGEAAGRLDDCGAEISRLRAALDEVPEGVVVCDAEGREVYRNEAARSFGTSRIEGVLAASAVQEHLATARRGKPAERLLELFTPIRRVLLIRAVPTQGPDGPTGAVAVIEDVSERRRVDAIRRDFVANVSHELKTPVGALSLLAETLDGEDDPEVIARLAARVTTEADRLGRLIDDLLDLSRIEANETPSWEELAVNDVLHQALEPVRPLAVASGISLVFTEPDPALVVLGDRWELVSAVTNLADNAVKYSERGGRVIVSATAGSDPDVGPDTVEVRVEDRGIGISGRDMERIFERFYRVDRARSRSTGGTGLGLSIVRHAVANHGGTVRVESMEGVGSTFTLVLPRAAVGEPAPEAPAEGESARA